jgi:hypothetical protein
MSTGTFYGTPPKQVAPVFHGTITVGKGREWHSTPFKVAAGDLVTLKAHSPSRFFAGVFSQSEYDAARRRSPLMFPFRLNSDQVAFDRAYSITITSDYRIVIRVSAFQRTTQIQLDVDRLY